VLYAHELGLVPITTPSYSPQSNGLADAFVKKFKRDYVDGAELRDAETVLTEPAAGLTTTTPACRTRRSGCAARPSTGRSSSR
jgi:hypothetical protein